MGNIAIRIEGLGKRYQLGHVVDFSRTFRETLLDLPRYFGKKTLGTVSNIIQSKSATETDHTEDTPPNTFWALKDINLEIKHGEVVGIIGRNGAGKSTLLKILSKITTPTTGRVELYGRVGSLLEVGTGFHPELTGRENIYLNGAILGMRKQEIDQKFDEIVAFAETEQFLDTPIKRYSSGMRVRLAFAVAAHLDPEILIVDEVLAVGDAAFQKKCLGKMGDVAKEGRTVLFVSHNMAAVENLCSRTIVLNEGTIDFDGNQEDGIVHYLSSNQSIRGNLTDRKDRKGTGDITVTSIEIKDEKGIPIEFAKSGQPIEICMHYEIPEGKQVSNAISSICVKTLTEIPIFLQHNRLTGKSFKSYPKRGMIRCHINELPLPSATFSLTYSIIKDGTILDSITNAMELNVENGDFFGTGEVPPITHGVCLLRADWELSSEEK